MIEDKWKEKLKEGQKYLENEEFNDVLLEFVNFRRKVKKPLTSYGLYLTVKTLESFSRDDVEKAIFALNKSIERGWQGVFEPFDYVKKVNYNLE